MLRKVKFPTKSESESLYIPVLTVLPPPIMKIHSDVNSIILCFYFLVSKIPTANPRTLAMNEVNFCNVCCPVFLPVLGAVMMIMKIIFVMRFEICQLKNFKCVMIT